MTDDEQRELLAVFFEQESNIESSAKSVAEYIRVIEKGQEYARRHDEELTQKLDRLHEQVMSLLNQLGETKTRRRALERAVHGGCEYDED